MKTILISILLGLSLGYLYGAANSTLDGDDIVNEYKSYKSLGTWEGLASCQKH